ncbi:hypothetical protein GDO86_018631 [Hymenochirus boettgeri]|uniref:Uncharacterized protein n=1 Tax=Hymenochirus boettgeri TaxID=247094 RepID=A0A8T2IG26_9PIPI|nr:hypothetical protein GDO86_018631 [Hymenochirus boettgeri]
MQREGTIPCGSGTQDRGGEGESQESRTGTGDIRNHRRYLTPGHNNQRKDQ